MLGNRLKQFREYNCYPVEPLAEMLGISSEEYLQFEEGFKNPTIDILSQLCRYYRITLDELYGYTPRLTLHSPESEWENNEVDQRVLKMADLTWDEAQIILYYRNLKSEHDEFKDELISEIIKRNYPDKKERP